ncbi:hypothetical protein FB45DRAFT_933987 [Roridomyces roridus]|uniref:Uncharacterized protein n=1 Tax=Roridomyces roridus TaxID=1738132 RepID=A0AAD7FGL6_9AGAR|nr:hypothetical protein FB45DRAFT_933987 [Roridomyces roridus]
MRWNSRMAEKLLSVAVLVIFVLNATGRLYKLKRRTRARYNYYFGKDGPPTYAKLRKWEAALPQHNLSLPFPEGKYGRYVRFSNQVRWLGWNNVFNDVLMSAHLAYISDRAYVFQDYYWAQEHYHWPPSTYVSYEARTPLPAIISGPVAGGAFEPGDTAPRSISDDWWEVVCPLASRRLINARQVKKQIPDDASGLAVLEHWQQILHDATESCVEVISANWEGEGDGLPQVFDLWVWSSPRVLSLWDTFSTSPISRLLGPSPIVQDAVERNSVLFAPRGSRPPSAAVVKDAYRRMLAIHLRRGDYESHCRNLAGYRSGFYGWAQFHHLPDRFDTETVEEKVFRRCFPDVELVVKKVAEARKDYLVGHEGGTLDVVYVLTNGEKEWVEALGEALRADGWARVLSSVDLVLDKEQMDVAMAVDMELARKAEVFVGNGWSSFTSNIVYQRLLDNRDPITIRFT